MVGILPVIPQYMMYHLACYGGKVRLAMLTALYEYAKRLSRSPSLWSATFNKLTSIASMAHLCLANLCRTWRYCRELCFHGVSLLYMVRALVLSRVDVFTSSSHISALRISTGDNRP